MLEHKIFKNIYLDRFSANTGAPKPIFGQPHHHCSLSPPSTLSRCARQGVSFARAQSTQESLFWKISCFYMCPKAGWLSARFITSFIYNDKVCQTGNDSVPKKGKKKIFPRKFSNQILVSLRSRNSIDGDPILSGYKLTRRARWLIVGFEHKVQEEKNFFFTKKKWNNENTVFLFYLEKSKQNYRIFASFRYVLMAFERDYCRELGLKSKKIKKKMINKRLVDWFIHLYHRSIIYRLTDRLIDQ